MSIEAHEPLTLIGDWTPRQLQVVSEEIGSSISLTANVILLALIVSEKNEVLKSYNRILLLNCVIDVIYTLASKALAYQFEIHNGHLIFVNNGLFKDAPMSVQYFLAWFYVWTCGLAIYAIPFMFYYRYTLVCKGVVLTMQKFFLALLVPIIFGSFDAFMLSSSHLQMRDRHEQLCREFLNHPLWMTPEVLPRNCIISGERSDPALVLFCLGVCFKGTSVYVTTIWFGVNIQRVIKESNKIASKKTIKMQTQLSRILKLQAALPLFTAVLPLSIMVALIIFKINIRGAGLVISAMLSWIPVVNPLSTIFLVSNYRQKLFGTILRCMLRKKSLAKSVEALDPCEQRNYDPFEMLPHTATSSQKELLLLTKMFRRTRNYGRDS